MQRGVSPINEYEHDQRLQSLKRVQQVSAHKLLYDVISPNIKHVTHGETSGQAQVRPQGCTHTSEYETRCRLFGERTSARTTGRSLFICCGCFLFSLSCIRYIIARISQKSRQNFSPHPQTSHYYPARRSKPPNLLRCALGYPEPHSKVSNNTPSFRLLHLSIPGSIGQLPLD